MAAAHPRRWQRGETAVLREVSQGRVWTARPLTVVADDEEGVALYLPQGMRWQRPADPVSGRWMRLRHGPWTLRESELTGGRLLHLLQPGAAHAIHLWWLAPDWRFAGWYVNLQEPFRRSPIGFDTLDNMLDIVIEPDRSWHWKDEDEVREAVRLGRVTRQWAAELRREGERVIGRLERNEAPFNAGWETWTPDPEWNLPVLPAAWDTMGLGPVLGSG